VVPLSHNHAKLVRRSVVMVVGFYRSFGDFWTRRFNGRVPFPDLFTYWTPSLGGGSEDGIERAASLESAAAISSVAAGVLVRYPFEEGAYKYDAFLASRG
jgi:hypothetical protein